MYFSERTTGYNLKDHQTHRDEVNSWNLRAMQEKQIRRYGRVYLTKLYQKEIMTTSFSLGIKTVYFDNHKLVLGKK